MRQYLTRKAGRFVLIVGGGILIAVVLWAATNVFNVALPGTDTSPLSVKLLVAPAAHDWVKEAADRFNADGRRLNRRPITLSILEQDGLSVYGQVSTTGFSPEPAAWITEGRFMLDLVNLAGRESTGQEAFSSETTIAQSVLMWGGFADRIGVLDSRFGGLNWTALREASLAAQGWSALGGRSEWGFFKLVLPDPAKSSEGLAALLVAAAEYHGKADLAAGDISSAPFQSWAQALIDAVPNFANLGAEPANALAVRGPSAGDAGLLLERDWLLAASSLSSRQPVSLRYASQTLIFDFTFAVRVAPPFSNTTQGDSERKQFEQAVEAARQFRDYLLDSAQQRRAEVYGLRPASGQAANPEGSLFAQWSSLGFQSSLPGGSGIHINAEAARAALRWVELAVGH